MRPLVLAHFTAPSRSAHAAIPANRVLPLSAWSAPALPTTATHTSIPVIASRRERPRGLYDLTLPELEARVEELGYPAYRARQVWGWAYRQLARDYAEMTNIPAALARRADYRGRQ